MCCYICKPKFFCFTFQKIEQKDNKPIVPHDVSMIIITSISVSNTKYQEGNTVHP